ncbi:hypothetical protein RHGRI_035693 [Rhododendron griersonianum]|uniref:TIR domain-containing protein n=1 Tax=Rhododendron griersonianum TaxID=479676 RepID=A0AAV6HN42_9ERIC|nr:hypothetical protein RHGRI_035693 [Rhododendron griersonianum]
METAWANQASSSSTPSSIPTPFKYDVFLSFSGVDTRKNFTSHLSAALKRHGFHTFIDDKELKRGEYIDYELLKAIELSRISLVVLSKNYAASRWCLDELVKIMECRKKLQQIVFPIFYNVDPSDVRAQKGSLAEAFAKHAERFNEGPGSKVEKWREALTEVANLPGWDLPKVANGNEAHLIQKAVEEVRNNLNIALLHVAWHEIGLESRLEKLKKLLKMETDDVRIVAIWGMAGIGKTTIAKKLYNLVQHKFEGSTFLANIRETSKQLNGQVVLQEQLLSDILKSGTHYLRNFHQGIEVIKRRALCRKVLLILDDVDDVQQLKDLAIDRDSFGFGSRIIVTTRDISSLNSLKVDEIYEAEKLNEDESLELFRWHCFKEDHPTEDHVDLSNQVVHCAGGLPLALEVLGSFFCGKSIPQWKSAIAKLRKIPDHDVQGKLRISFDSLSKDVKEMFLDVACFFVGTYRSFTVKILESCHSFAEIWIRVLADRCLIKYHPSQIVMHDLLRDMGREIVRQESVKDPGRRSRLWHHEDILGVLGDGTGTEAVEGLVLNFHEPNEVQVNSKAFEKMNRLWLLCLNYVHLRKGYEHISRRLMCLCWIGFPLKCLPSKLHMENLVTLDLRYSSLKKAWKGTKILVKLKFLYLSNCYHLIETPGFSGLKNLEELLLNDCISLVEVDESIIFLNKLVILDMKNCKKLQKIPSSILTLKSLESLDLSGCSMLGKFSGFKGSPSKSQSSFLSSWIFKTKRMDSIGLSSSHVFGLSCLKDLRMENCNLSCLPNEVGNLILLETLDLSGNNLPTLPDSICDLTRLKRLTLEGCNLLHLPSEIGRLISLDTLGLQGNSLRNLPDSILNLARLKSLHLKDSNVTHLPSEIGRRLISLETLNLEGNRLLTLPDSICNLPCLEALILNDCNLSHLPDRIGMLSSLKLLELERNNVCSLPNSFSDLASLEDLRLNDCGRLQSLPQLPVNILRVDASYCTSLENIPIEFNWQAGLRMSFGGCNMLAKSNSVNNFIERLHQYKGWSERSELHIDTNISLPLDEVPNWFEYQCAGSKFSLVVPPLENRRIVGWSFCVVFSTNGTCDKDDKELKRGEYIDNELLKAIEESRISLVVLSKNYAASRWCLDELVKIMECRKKLQQIVFPIFHGVEPSDVRAQKGSLAESFSKHAERFNEGPGSKVEKWKEALTHVANLSGWDLPKVDNGDEAHLIWKAVEEVQNKLDIILLHVACHEIGLESRLQKLKLLKMETDDVRIVAICGMGGIGETTIAKKLYNLVQQKFEDPSKMLKLTIGLLSAFLTRSKPLIDFKFTKKCMHQSLQDAKVYKWSAICISRDEETLIQKIVEEVRNKLDVAHLDVVNHIVGLESRLQKLNVILSMESSDVRIVGIWGICGIGKTTKAKSLFYLIQHKFEHSSFLADIRETTKQLTGLVVLQQKLLSDIFVSGTQTIKNVHQGIEVIKRRAFFGKVLLVMDDVDDVQQLKALAISRDSFAPGSRIIITTRDRSLLNFVELDENEIYVPEELNKDESLELFSWHAFKEDHPREDYVELSDQFVYYAWKVPLALEVLGSFLFRKSIPEWKRALPELKQILLAGIYGRLKISLNTLNDEVKELFLDLACFFAGTDRDFTIKILEGCNISAAVGIQVLADQCLIKYGPRNELIMDDMLIDMGREIVRQQSVKDPGKRSRLWYHEDALEVLKDGTGTEVVEGLVLNFPKPSDVLVNAKAFKKMNRLWLLHLNHVHLRVGYEHISRRLLWLCWNGFALECVPSNFFMENLVALDLRYSSLKQVWDGSHGTKILPKLKFLYLSHCYYLTKTPDFSGLDNLEELLLNDCVRLVDVDESIIYLDKLVVLDLKNCEKLRRIPLRVWMMKSLRCLDISGCCKLVQFAGFERLPDSFGLPLASVQGLSCLKKLSMGTCHLSHLPIEIGSLISLEVLHLYGKSSLTLPSNICNITRLKLLDLTDCNFSHLPGDIGRLISLETLNLGGNCLIVLPSSICNLIWLKFLDLKDCTLSHLPGNIGGLISLETLNLGGNRLVELPGSICDLTRLKSLDLKDCNVSYLPGDIGGLISLETLNLGGNDLLALPSSICNLTRLKSLDLKDCKVSYLPGDIGGLVSLETLNVQANRLVELPGSICDLTRLKSLDLKDCNVSYLPGDIGGLISLETLNLGGNDLLALPGSICHLTRLKSLDLKDCKVSYLPNNIGGLVSLQTLNVRGNRLVELPGSICDLTRLKSLDLKDCNVSYLPGDIGGLMSLETLNLGGNRLVYLLGSICDLTRLKSLDLKDCNVSYLPSDIGWLISLETLNLGGNDLLALPGSICNLACLKSLDLKDCKLSHLPNDIGGLVSLETLNVRGNRLVELPSSICDLTRLKSLDLKDCNVSELPGDIGRLVSLETLNVGGNNLLALPSSVFNVTRLNVIGFERL